MLLAGPGVEKNSEDLRRNRYDCLAGPAELCGGRAGVDVAFIGGGAYDFLGDFGVETFAPAGGEGFLHATIFAGMEREDGHAPAGIEARGEMAEKGFERRELVVHRNRSEERRVGKECR